MTAWWCLAGRCTKILHLKIFTWPLSVHCFNAWWALYQTSHITPHSGSSHPVGWSDLIWGKLFRGVTLYTQSMYRLTTNCVRLGANGFHHFRQLPRALIARDDEGQRKIKDHRMLLFPRSCNSVVADSWKSRSVRSYSRQPSKTLLLKYDYFVISCWNGPGFETRRLWLTSIIGKGFGA